jgi:hypothetical protein
MEVRLPRPGISPDIPRELEVICSRNSGSVDAVLVVIASTSHNLEFQQEGISKLA